MTPTDFRAAYPEFADPAAYPDQMVQMWLTAAQSFVNSRRWMELTDLGIGLVTAHNLVLGARNAKAAAVGGVPGQMTGPQSAKSVGSVSASYDTGAAVIADGGAWNLTTYGVEYLTLARMMGAGGVQV